VENKTRTNKIDGEKPTVVFLSKFVFEKDILPVNAK
jgi:hypothetical protein